MSRIAGLIGVAVLALQPFDALASDVYSFGEAHQQFTMDFVTIGDPGNVADTSGAPNPAGAVDYLYDMGKYEVSREMIEKANSGGQLNLTMASLWDLPIGPQPWMPATSVNWNEAARFVNWLNAEQGFSPAYKFATQPGERGYSPNTHIQLWNSGDPGFDPANPFRNQHAHFFLPSTDEWYKAAFYDRSKGVDGGYWDYGTGSDAGPIPVSQGVEPGTAVHSQEFGPADITLAGGLSPYGVMAMSGNVWEMMETAYDRENDDVGERRSFRGGSWHPAEQTYQYMSSSFIAGDVPSFPADDSNNLLGFRVASRVSHQAPGDTNGDGVVDLVDLNNVRNHFGDVGLGDTSPFDGDVDLDDLNAVRNNFGATGGATAVPEPSAVLMVLLGALAIGIWRAVQLAVCKQTEMTD
jgi:hypothetical protein